MNLAAAQQAFIAEIAADDDHPSSSLGMAIYRNAYRARLVTALEVSFERTRVWVGEEAFAAAAAHHVLTKAPHSWTLDAYGADFPATLATLFAEDPEVSEIAWLEWHMQHAFAAPDCGALSPADLAAMAAREIDWDSLRLVPAAGMIWRTVSHDLASLWHDTEAGAAQPIAPHVAMVWRQGFTPRFRLLESEEFAALAPLLQGEPFGQAAAAMADRPELFGNWFAGWVAEGLFSAALAPGLPSLPPDAAH